MQPRNLPRIPTSNIGDESNTIAYAYLALQVVNTMSFYLSTVTPLELAEIAACGAVTGYSRAQARKEAKEILNPDTLDKIFEETLKEHEDLKPGVDIIEEHCANVYKSHKEKLEKGTLELAKEGALEDSFLALHKLNFAAIDRFFTRELLKNNGNHDIKNILAIKSSLVAGIMTSAVTIKKGSMLAGEGVGVLMHKMKSYLGKDENETLDFMVKELAKVARRLSPLAYLGYQAYKISTRVSHIGVQAALLPIDATVVAVSGLLAGITEITQDGKKSDLRMAYETIAKQSWYEFSKTVLFSTTGLCGDILRDWGKSYNLATGNREKFITSMSKGLEEGIKLKPHKEGSKLLFYSVVAEQVANNEATWLHNPIITVGTMVTGAFRATLGTSAKYTFKGARQAGQLTGEVLKHASQITTGSYL